MEEPECRRRYGAARRRPQVKGEEKKTENLKLSTKRRPQPCPTGALSQRGNQSHTYLSKGVLHEQRAW